MQHDKPQSFGKLLTQPVSVKSPDWLGTLVLSCIPFGYMGSYHVTNMLAIWGITGALLVLALSCALLSDRTHERWVQLIAIIALVSAMTVWNITDNGRIQFQCEATAIFTPLILAMLSCAKKPAYPKSVPG